MAKRADRGHDATQEVSASQLLKDVPARPKGAAVNDVSMWAHKVVGTDEFAPAQPRRAERSRGWLIAAVLGTAVVAGGGIAYWSVRDSAEEPAGAVAAEAPAAKPAPTVAAGSATSAAAATGAPGSTGSGVGSASSAPGAGSAAAPGSTVPATVAAVAVTPDAISSAAAVVAPSKAAPARKSVTKTAALPAKKPVAKKPPVKKPAPAPKRRTR